MQHSPPLDVSSWYMLVHDDELQQGDILMQCPLFMPPKGLRSPFDPKAVSSFQWTRHDVIVLSQSCDIKAGQKANPGPVMLCSVRTLSDAAKLIDYLGTEFGKNECRDGKMPAYYMLN